MNLTITIDKEILQRARIRAIEEDTSVNAVVRRYLESYAGVAHSRREATEHLLHLSKTTKAARGSARWTRDELHDR